MKLSELSDALSAPFPPQQVHWRIGPRNRDKTKGQPLAYLNARDVMARLDEVVGPDHWSDQYTAEGSRVFCHLTICGVTKGDGAGATDMEGDKGAISDAFKRAAVKFGVGRYLYYCDAPWIDLDNGKMPRGFDGSPYLPAPSTFSSKQMKTKVWNALRDAAAEGDALKAKETADELTNGQKLEIWNEFSSGQRAELKRLLAE